MKLQNINSANNIIFTKDKKFFHYKKYFLFHYKSQKYLSNKIENTNNYLFCNFINQI
jgi:hypothetical protein